MANSTYFQRFTPDNLDALQTAIDEARIDLERAQQKGDISKVLDIVASLGSMLTTARQENEARQLLLESLPLARKHNDPEKIGWLLLALATVNQYLDCREEANEQFTKTLRIARKINSERLEHFVLQHWGRCLVEDGDIEQARRCFTRALKIREKNDDPMQVYSRQALEALSDKNS